MSTSDIVSTVLVHVFSTLVLALRYSIISLEYCLSAYPKITTYALTLVAVYITYKLILKMIRMWINFIISIIKLTLFLFLIMFLALVYLRGSKLFTQDFAFVSNLVKSRINFDGWSSIFENDTSAADYLDSAIRWGYSKANGGIWNLLTDSLYFLLGGNQSLGNKGNPVDFGFGFEFDERAFEYAKQFAKENLDKDTVMDFVAGNMENIEHMIRDLGIDVNQVLNNFMQQNR